MKGVKDYDFSLVSTKNLAKHFLLAIGDQGLTTLAGNA